MPQLPPMACRAQAEILQMRFRAEWFGLSLEAVENSRLVCAWLVLTARQSQCQ